MCNWIFYFGELKYFIRLASLYSLIPTLNVFTKDIPPKLRPNGNILLWSVALKMDIKGNYSDIKGYFINNTF